MDDQQAGAPADILIVDDTLPASCTASCRTRLAGRLR